MWINAGLCTGFSTVCTQVFGGYAQGADLHAGAFPAQNRGAQWLWARGQDSQSGRVRLTMWEGKIVKVRGQD